MPTDARQERKRHLRPSSGRQGASFGRWWKWGLPLTSVLVVVILAVVLIASVSSSGETGPKLTHRIARGDLIVTVTEQGLLESAENTEIKCEVRGLSTVIWVIDNGAEVEPGDVLVRLDTLAIEDAINERSKYAHWSRSSAERSIADVARAELAISQYLEGRYRADLMTLEKELIVANSNLRSAQNILAHAEKMANRGYVSEFEVEEKRFAVRDAELSVEVKNSQIDVLKTYSKEMQLETLNGNLRAAKAKLAADAERARMDAARRDEALEELEYCIIKAERGGLVIHPSAARWENAPEIEEGATVYKDQVLLLMPDLSKMQVKVGIHESVVDRIRPGLAAKVTLPQKILNGEVSSVASVTGPAGWWTGNQVKYDTIIELLSVAGLKPGMSAEVEVVIAQYSDVLTIPVAAVVETAEGAFCWVKTPDGAKRRLLKLGDTNKVFTVVKAGLREGDEVVLNSYALETPQIEARKPVEEETDRGLESSEFGNKPKPSDTSAVKSSGDLKDLKSKLEMVRPDKIDSKSK